MPKAHRVPKKRPRRKVSPSLVGVAILAIVVATGLYGVNAGWFEPGEPEFQTPKLGQPPPPRPVDPHDDDIARSTWGAAPAAPVVGAGIPGLPTSATVPVRDGRADVTVRVPLGFDERQPYSAYTVTVTSGTQRLWGSFLPIAENRSQDRDAFSISFNAALLASIGQTGTPLQISVTGTLPRRSVPLGFVQVTVEPAP